MNKALLVFLGLTVLALTAQAGTTVLLKTIDPFTPDTPTIIVTIVESQLPITQTAFTQDAGILGGERDLSLTAETGTSNRILTAGVTDGEWDVSTPNGASGIAIMQYDGTDASINLNTRGLGGENFVALGGSGLRATIQTDIDTEYTFTVYDMNGGQSSITIPVPGEVNVLTDYSLPFSSFSGNADFTNVGAIEIDIELFANVDSTISLIGVEGSVNSASATPQPNPSASSTPAGSNWYTFDDDDDGISPCGDEEPHRRTYFLSSDRVIYYYFYGQVDDGDTVIVLESGSDGNVLFTSAVVLMTVIATLFGL